MRVYQRITGKKEIGRSAQGAWKKGLNKLVSNTQIREDEISDAVDIQLVEDGKIQCPRDGQAYFGESSGSKVSGIFPFYKSDGTVQLIRMCGTHLQKYNAGTWSNISGFTYTDSLDTEGITAYDKLYLVNGTDNLTVYDGSTISSFTEISAPSAPTVARNGGSSGSYTFSYKITAVTAVGETPVSTAGSTTLNQSTLDSTHKMDISWSAVTNATGYSVWGRKDGKWYFIIYLEGNSSTSYSDDGSITPEEAFLPPEGNTTGGPKGISIALYKDSLFIFGESSNPSRLYYSAGGDLLTDFTVGNGGGFIDIAKNNGQKGKKVVTFKDSLLCFKEASIYKFSFSSSGLPQVEQVTESVGAMSTRSVVLVENDVFFASDRGIFTIGNEAGFAFDVLRTNELSAKVRSLFQLVDSSRITNISAVYATVANKNLVIFAYTPSGASTNSKALVYDRERLAWYYWTNIQANCWGNYRDSSGVSHVLYGDDASGYVKEILTGSSDFGSEIIGSFRLRAEDFKQPARYKRLKKIDLILRTPTGSIDLNIIKDGIATAATVPITTTSPSVNWGHYLFTGFLFGESVGTGVSAQEENLLKTIKNVQLEGRSFLLEFSNSSAGQFTLLYAGMEAKMRSIGYRKSDDLVDY